MKNRTFITGSVVALVLAVAAPLAFAQHRMHQHAAGLGGPMMLEHLQRVKTALDLSDDQVTQIQSIFADLRAQNAPYREQLRGGRQAILQTLLANPNDTAAAQALIDQQTAAERALKTNVLNAASRALNVLTADQRAKLAAFVQERMARRANR